MGRPPAPEVISYMVKTALRQADEKRPRSIQKAEGVLGPSDIGFCRSQALLVVKQVPPSDSTPGWAASLGNSVGAMTEAALKDAYPDWIIGSIDQRRVTYGVRMPDGTTVRVPGTPDILVPEWNTCLDIKSKDGLALAKRDPWSQSHRFQTWLYAQGAAAEGILDPDQPLYTGLIYVDRSGGDDTPHVVWDEVDPGIESKIADWIGDVIYARLHDEETSRDIAAPICERICEWYTVCRGDLPMQDSEPIVDDYLLEMIDRYLEAAEMEKAAKQLKSEARDELRGVNGSTGSHTVRWNYINPSSIAATDRAGYDRLDIRKTRPRQ